MALELVFECPRTLKKLRSGPLGRILDGFCDWLLEHGFTRYTVRTHLSNVSHLNEHLGARNGAGWRTLSPQTVNGFLRGYPLQARNRGPLGQHLSRVQFSVSRFIEYLSSSGLFEPSTKTPIYQPLRDAYLQWMRIHQHAAAGTIELRSHSISQFLEWLGPKATPQGCLELTAETVERFFLPYAQKDGPLSAPLDASGFAHFLAVLFISRLSPTATRPRCADMAHLQAGHGSAWTHR